MYKHFKRLDPTKTANEDLYGRNMKQTSKDGKAKSLLIHNFGGLKAKGEEACPIKGAKSYLCRDLIGSDENDILAIPKEYEEVSKELLEIMRDLGLPVAKKEQLIGIHIDQEKDESLEETLTPALRDYLDESLLKALHIVYMLPYMHTEPVQEVIESHHLRADQKNATPTWIADNKCISIEEMERRGVRTPRGKRVFTPEEAIQYYEQTFRNGDTAVIKLPFSSSGHGVFRLRDREAFEKQLQEQMVRTYFRENGNGNAFGVRIEQLENIEWSPGISFWVGKTPEEDRILNATEQILLDDIEHDGNIAPVRFFTPEMEKILAQAAEWLRSIGSYGPNGVDLGITPEGEAIFMEINPRKPGHFQYNLANHNITQNPLTPWIGSNIHIPKGVALQDFILYLQNHQIFFNPETKRGVIPANWAGVKEFGKAQVFVIGKTVEDAKEMFKIAGAYK